MQFYALNNLEFEIILGEQSLIDNNISLLFGEKRFLINNYPITATDNFKFTTTAKSTEKDPLNKAIEVYRSQIDPFQPIKGEVFHIPTYDHEIISVPTFNVQYFLRDQLQKHIHDL